MVLVFLDDDEKSVFRGTKVVHLCLLNDHYARGERPDEVSFTRDWPPEIQRGVLDRWSTYGYAGPTACLISPTSPRWRIASAATATDRPARLGRG